METDLKLRLLPILTHREIDVFQRLVDGYSNREIAEELVLAESTVKWYARQIYAKLGVQNRRQLTLFASQPSHATNSHAPGVECPYKGLRSFQTADAEYFFGRESLIAHLITKLDRFLAVVGPSGIGKSSVINAGLIPALQAGELPGSERWQYVECVPGENPWEALEAALRPFAPLSALPLFPEILHGKDVLGPTIQRIFPDGDVFLFVDQFEELFTQTKDKTRRDLFLENLCTAVRAAESRLRVVIALRADFYDRPLTYPVLGELIQQHTEIVLPLTPEQLEQAIIKPAEQVGLSLETGLLATIIADTKGMLPLLQYTLMALFEHRAETVLTRTAYETMGGVSGALLGRAEMLYTRFGDAMRQLFLRLIWVDENLQVSRQRVPLSEVQSLDIDSGTLDALIDGLADDRLLTFDYDRLRAQPTLEIAHEALITHWQRLTDWVNDYRTDLRLDRQLRASVQEWLNAGRDPDYLMSGSRLHHYELWAAEGALPLSKPVKAFLALSRRAEDLREHKHRRLQQQAINRLRYLVVVMALFATVVVGLLFLVAYNRHEADRQEREAQSYSLVSSAQLALKNGNTDLAVTLALAANRIVPDPPPLVQQTLFEAGYAQGTRRVFRGHSGSITALRFRSDGRAVLSGSVDGKLIMWDIESGSSSHIATLPDSVFVTSLALNKRGQTALVGLSDGTILLWDVVGWRNILTFSKHQRAITGVAFSPDEQTVYSVSQDGRLKAWDAITGVNLKTETPFDAGLNSIALSANGTTALIATGNTRYWIDSDTDQNNPSFILLWDVQKDREIRRFTGQSAQVVNAVFSADEKYILSSFTDGELILWDTTTGQPIRRLEGRRSQTTFVALSPDGRRVLTSSWDTSVILWDVSTGKPVHQFQGHRGIVTQVQFSPDGKTAISGASDGELRLWNIESDMVLRDFGGTDTNVNAAAFNPAKQWVMAAGSDGIVTQWKLADNAARNRFQSLPNGAWSVAISTDGQYVLVASGRSRLSLFEASTGRLLQRFEGHTDTILDVKFSPDSHFAFSLSRDGTLRQWEVETGRERRQFVFEGTLPRVIALSADGRAVAVGGINMPIQGWIIATGEPLVSITPETLLSMTYSPDGKYLAGGTLSGAILIWDSVTGQLKRRLEGHTDGVQSLTFSADGTMLLSTSDDDSIILWSLQTGNELIRYRDSARWAWFHPDGILTVSERGEVKLWRVMPSVDSMIAWITKNRYILPSTCVEHISYQIEPEC